MREMKDSGIEWIGEIPVDWSMKRVKHIFTRKNEKAMQENPTILSLARDGVKVRDISNNEGQIAESYYNYNPVEEGDLLLNPMDLYSGANCSISKVQGVISPAYINLKANTGVNPDFYDYYFKVQYWLMAFFSYGKGVSYDNRWTLSAETLMNYPVVDLSYEEQCKRADYLDRKCSQIDAIIARQQEVIEKLKAYKLSVITEAVTKGLNPDVPMKDSGVEWIGEIPEDWEVSKLKFMGHFVNGYAFPSNSFTTDGVRVMKIANIQPMEISWIDESYVDVSEYDKLPTYRVEQGDLVFALTRPIINGGIKVAMFDGKEKVLLNQRNAMFKGLSRVLPRWMYYVMQNQMYVQKFALYIDGTGQQPNISTNEISQIEIPIPPIEVQQQVIMKLNEVMASIEKLTLLKERMIKQLSDYKKSLIYEVVTGKKAV